MKCFQNRNCSKQGKKQRSIGIEFFYLKTSYGFEYKRNCISKFYMEMFIYRKTRAGNAYAYQMLLSFQTSVTYKKKLTSNQRTLSILKQLSQDITPFSAGHCPMSNINIQAANSLDNYVEHIFSLHKAFLMNTSEFQIIGLKILQITFRR